MSPEESLSRLVAAFERCIQLNQELLVLLQKGEALETLDQHFAAKAQVLAELKAYAGELGGGTAPGLSGRAFEVQAQAARLETQVAEALGSRQKHDNVSAITKAYGDKKLDKGPSRHLDVET